MANFCVNFQGNMYLIFGKANYPAVPDSQCQISPTSLYDACKFFKEKMSLFSEVKVVNDTDIFLIRQIILALNQIDVDLEPSNNIVTTLSNNQNGSESVI